MFGGLLEKGRKLHLVDINLPVTVRSPCLLRESTRLVQYWRGDKKSANPPNIIPRQYFWLYGITLRYPVWLLQLGYLWVELFRPGSESGPDLGSDLGPSPRALIWVHLLGPWTGSSSSGPDLCPSPRALIWVHLLGPWSGSISSGPDLGPAPRAVIWVHLLGPWSGSISSGRELGPAPRAVIWVHLLGPWSGSSSSGPDLGPAPRAVIWVHLLGPWSGSISSGCELGPSPRALIWVQIWVQLLGLWSGSGYVLGLGPGSGSGSSGCDLVKVVYGNLTQRVDGVYMWGQWQCSVVYMYIWKVNNTERERKRRTDNCYWTTMYCTSTQCVCVCATPLTHLSFLQCRIIFITHNIIYISKTAVIASLSPPQHTFTHRACIHIYNVHA